MAHRSMGGGPRGPINFVCPICRRPFTEPKVLNCYHVVCLDCLRPHVHTYCRNGLFPCPMCKVLIPMPVWGGLDAFETLDLKGKTWRDIIVFVTSQCKCSSDVRLGRFGRFRNSGDLKGKTWQDMTQCVRDVTLHVFMCRSFCLLCLYAYTVLLMKSKPLPQKVKNVTLRTDYAPLWVFVICL